MYQITCDNEILYDIRLKNRLVLSPVLDLEIGKNGTLSFIIPPSNDLYNSIQQRKSIIKVYQVDRINNSYVRTELFRGIAYSEKTDFWKRKQIECEGELSFFNDTVVRPYEFNGTVTNLFKQYVNNHNSQVGSEKQFTPRNCDFNSNVVRANINYPSTKEEIDNKLINLLGGHFEVEESNNVRYIDYKQNYSNNATQYIEFGKNLLNITQFIKTDDVATRIIPLGKKDNNGNYLTIKGVNNNLDYVQDNSAVALFGVIEKTVIFEDVTLANNLLLKGNAYLNETINKTVSIELSASDLHNLDVNIESFRIGDNVKVISTPHGLNRYFLLSKLHLTLDNVASCSMTLGATFKSFTQKQVDSEKKIDSVSENIITTNQDVSRIDSEVQEINTFIEAVPTDYLSIEDFNLFKDELALKLTGVHTEKGSVTDVEDLEDIEDPVLGDIYKIINETNNTYTRYIYNGNAWEELLDLNNGNS